MLHRVAVMQLEVKVDLDGVPGWGHQHEDFVRLLKEALERAVPHYNPSVTLKSVEFTQREGCPFSERNA